MSTRKTKNELAAELDATRAELDATRADLDAARAEVAAARAEVEQLRSRRWAPLDGDVAALVDRVRGRVRTLEQWGTAVIPPRPDRIGVIARTAESELERLAAAFQKLGGSA
jgi:hypothetical protein